MSKSTNIKADIEAKISDLSVLWETLQIEKKEQDVGSLPHRVIHLKNNPSQMAIDEQLLEFENLRKENQQLKARLEILQSGCDLNVTREIDVAVDNANSIQEMKARLEEYKRREEKILSSFRVTSRNFRRAVSSLTGFKMDALKDGVYKLFTDENDDDQSLKFRLLPEGNMELIQTEMSLEYEDNLRTYVTNGDSFPAFVASIIMNEFNTNRGNATQSEPVSMSLSETIMPNPRSFF